jgi:hypothetical protein
VFDPIYGSTAKKLQVSYQTLRATSGFLRAILGLVRTTSGFLLKLVRPSLAIWGV